jgi:hypothetical protein
MLQSLASKEKDIAVIYLDVWKYSSDPLKRWILLETCRQLQCQGTLKDYKYQDRTLQSHLEFEEQVQDENKIKLDYKYLFRYVGILAAFIVIVVLASLYLPASLRASGVLNGLLIVLASAGLTSVVFVSIVIDFLKKISGLVFRRTIRHVTAKPAFSSEKFGEIFQHIVQTATRNGISRILFVFDNLDRCAEAVAVETIGVIKTYLDEPNCVYLIPCDEKALLRHISGAYAPAASGYESAKEFLNKFFQTTVRLPIASDFDIEHFLDKQLEAALMTDLPPEARDVLVLGYLGQTPRQIKRVINDLIVFRALAAQSEREHLVGDRELTGDLPLLTKMAVISEKWPDLLIKLGDDPDLWSELTERGSGPSADTSETGLADFLSVTRHVSPNSDPRAFIFLKRVDFERDVPLSKAVEECLRKGELSKYGDLLKQEPDSARREIVVRKTLSVCRQWLDNNRTGFLKNAAPLLVRSALLLPDERQLRFLALNVAEFLATGLSSDQLEEIVDVGDILELDSGATTHQKKVVLSKLALIFMPQFASTEKRRRDWSLMLQHQGQLTSGQKADIAQWIRNRYGSKVEGEEGALAILESGRNNPKDFRWCISNELLMDIITSVDFSGTSTDEARISTLTAYQSELDTETRSELATKMALSIDHSGSETYDETAELVSHALEGFNVTGFEPSELDSLGNVLLKQIIQSSADLKPKWVAPIQYIYAALSETLRSSVDTFFVKLIGEPTDVRVSVKFLTQLEDKGKSWLLSLPAIRQALRSQPAYLLRLGKSQALSNREDSIRCFDPAELLAFPEVFDESQTSELLLYVKTIQGAAKSDSANLEDLRAKLGVFCAQQLTGKLPANIEIYDGIREAVQGDPRLLDANLAATVSRCAIELMASDIESDDDIDVLFEDFQTWRKELSDEEQTSLVRELTLAFLPDRKDHWMHVLSLLSEDLDASSSLHNDKKLVRELFDYAFGAAEEEPDDGIQPLLKILPHLAQRDVTEYMDRSMDTLIAYEADRKPLERMEPFLATVENAKGGISGSDERKITKFCKRMLGPANTEEERKRTLQLIGHLNRKELTDSLRSELEEAAASEDEELALSAKALLR